MICSCHLYHCTLSTHPAMQNPAPPHCVTAMLQPSFQLLSGHKALWCEFLTTPPLMKRERLPRPPKCQVSGPVALGCPSPTMTPIYLSLVLRTVAYLSLAVWFYYPLVHLPCLNTSPCQVLSWALGIIWAHQMWPVSSRRIQAHGSSRKLTIRMPCVGPVRGAGSDGIASRSLI